MRPEQAGNETTLGDSDHDDEKLPGLRGCADDRQ